MVQRRRIERSHAIVGGIAATLAIATGLVVVNACGLGDGVDEHVTPPKINPVSTVSVSDGTTESSSAAFTVPPSPTWQIAPETVPRQHTTVEETTTTRTTVRRPTAPTTTRSLGTVRPSTASTADDESPAARTNQPAEDSEAVEESP